VVTIQDISRFMISLGLGTSLLSACDPPADSTSPAQHMSVARAERIAAADKFPGKYTGNAMATPFLKPTDQLAVSGAVLSFDAGARTAWHSHPAGQTLFVTTGTGWVQEWGRTRIEIKPGDVVWTPPGVKHWHGGTSTSEMSHVAIQGGVGGRDVEWMEPVTDEQYAGR
jgi:quercetin dioxygenase-like cupin family protein